MAAQNRADSLYQQGDYQGAITISSGQSEGDSGAAFEEFDESMQDAIEEARDTLRTRIDNARRTSSNGPDLIIALSTLAAFAVVVGIAPRIREYL
jgi:flavin-binding protein dodecin